MLGAIEAGGLELYTGRWLSDTASGRSAIECPRCGQITTWVGQVKVTR